MNLEFTLLNVDSSEIDKFSEELSNTFKYMDVYETDTAFNLKPHYHNDFESRLFLEGNATFIINGETVECSRGSYIEIYPEIIHSFEYDGKEHLKVLRYFKENASWDATFVD